MLYISTSKIHKSTVGASFTVSFTVAPDEIGYLTALHEKYAEMNMCGFTIKPSDSEKPNNSTCSKMEQVDYDCKSCKHDLWHTPRMCGKCVRQEDGKPSMYEPQTDEEYINNLPWTEAGNGEQKDIEIARAIVHKAIDDAVIAEDAYPDLRQKMHDAVDNYEPQTEKADRIPYDPLVEMDIKRMVEARLEQTDCAWKGEE